MLKKVQAGRRPVSHAIMSSMQYCPEVSIAYSILSAGRFCICNCVSPSAAAYCNCFRPDTFAYAVVSAPVQNRPYSKLNALGRRNTFTILLQAKCM